MNRVVLVISLMMLACSTGHTPATESRDAIIVGSGGHTVR